MRIVKSWKGASGVVRHWRENSLGGKPWQVRWTPICASTEFALSTWLKEKPFIDNQPRAYIAARQRNGFGQSGKIWHSPFGGVWISAAMPLEVITNSSGIFGLAVAFALAERLEKKGIASKIKWPNDLIVDQRKLAGFLPRVLSRGNRVRMARIGIGLNVFNKAPKEGISLVEVLDSCFCKTDVWAAEVLLALDRSIDLVSKPDSLCKHVELRLWNREVREKSSGEVWSIQGIDNDGALKLTRGNIEKRWTRWQ